MPKIGRMVEEALGVDRKAITLITKTVETFKHFDCAGFRISEESYGGKYEKLVGTGQGNMVSGAICRDHSCLVFSKLERLKKGIELILPLSLKKVRRTQIAHADDTDFFL